MLHVGTAFPARLVASTLLERSIAKMAESSVMKNSVISRKFSATKGLTISSTFDKYVRTSKSASTSASDKKEGNSDKEKFEGKGLLGSLNNYVRSGNVKAKNDNFKPGNDNIKPEEMPKHGVLYSKLSNPADMPAPPWKEAASIIIAARTSLSEVVGNDLGNLMGAAVRKKNTRCDYRLLMVKRSSLSSFMANAYVFPGGLVELADFSPRWYEVFERLGVSRESLEAQICTSVVGPRPAMITNPSTLAGADRKGQTFLSADIALRIAAIRETFEETGILLLTKPPKHGTKISSDLLFSMKDNSSLNLIEWRDRIHEDPLNFIELCLETGTCPNLWSLYEWWDWLTPTSVGHRRYDTMFYLCCLDKQPEVVLDQSEVITLKWCAPDDMLEEHFNNSVFLAPPQVYELSRMHHLRSYVQLQQFAQKRSTEGVQQWLPVIATAQDGALSLLPGDDMYPEEPDYFGRQPGPDYPFTLSELQSRVRHFHRMAVQGPICTAYCNITPGCGHLQPLTYRPTQPIVQSYL